MQSRLVLLMSPLTAVSLLIVVKLLSAVVTHVVLDSTCKWTGASVVCHSTPTATTTTAAAPATNRTTDTAWVGDTATNASVLTSSNYIVNNSTVPTPSPHVKMRTPIGGRYFLAGGGTHSDVIESAHNACPIDLLRLASRIRAEQDRLRDVFLQLDIANNRELKHEHVSFIPPTWCMLRRGGDIEPSVCFRRTTLCGRLCRRWSIAARFAAQDRLEVRTETPL